MTDFISEYKCSHSICDDLIEFFDQNKHLHHLGLTSTQTVDKSKKDSIDLCVEANDNAEPLNNYKKSLWDNMYDYAKQNTGHTAQPTASHTRHTRHTAHCSLSV